MMAALIPNLHKDEPFSGSVICERVRQSPRSPLSSSAGGAHSSRRV
jgi:hypothetical protein